MYAILFSAFNAALTFVVRSVIAKFFVFFALFFVTTEFLAVLVERLPNGQAMSGALAGIPPGMWYFLDLVHFDIGLPAILSAWVLRFMIRRIPVIG